MPFYFDYDLLLLAIPAVLWAREFVNQHHRRPLAGVDRVCLFGWVGLYLWTFLNPPLAGRMRLDLSVVFVALIAGSLIVRALQAATEANQAETDTDETDTPTAQAA
jgi:hypothetical protein